MAGFALVMPLCYVELDRGLFQSTTGSLGGHISDKGRRSVHCRSINLAATVFQQSESFLLLPLLCIIISPQSPGITRTAPKKFISSLDIK